MNPSHKTQKASLAAAIDAYRKGRIEGSKSQQQYHAEVLESLYARMERAEQPVKAEKEKQ